MREGGPNADSTLHDHHDSLLYILYRQLNAFAAGSARRLLAKGRIISYISETIGPCSSGSFQSRNIYLAVREAGRFSLPSGV